MQFDPNLLGWRGLALPPAYCVAPRDTCLMYCSAASPFWWREGSAFYQHTGMTGNMTPRYYVCNCSCFGTLVCRVPFQPQYLLASRLSASGVFVDRTPSARCRDVKREHVGCTQTDSPHSATEHYFVHAYLSYIDARHTNTKRQKRTQPQSASKQMRTRESVLGEARHLCFSACTKYPVSLGDALRFRVTWRPSSFNPKVPRVRGSGGRGEGREKAKGWMQTHTNKTEGSRNERHDNDALHGMTQLEFRRKLLCEGVDRTLSELFRTALPMAKHREKEGRGLTGWGGST